MDIEGILRNRRGFDGKQRNGTLGNWGLKEEEEEEEEEKKKKIERAVKKKSGKLVGLWAWACKLWVFLIGRGGCGGGGVDMSIKKVTVTA